MGAFGPRRHRRVSGEEVAVEAELLLRGRAPAPSPSSAGALLAGGTALAPRDTALPGCSPQQEPPCGQLEPPSSSAPRHGPGEAKGREALGARRCGLQGRRLGQERV